MAAFANWLASLFESILAKGYNLLIDLLQGAFDGLMTAIVAFVSLFPSGSPLPTGPATPTGSFFDQAINAINWVFPVGYMLSLVTFLVGGYLSYIIIAPLARWLKLLT